MQPGRPDSNRRSPAPKAGGLPGFPTPRVVQSSAQRESNPHVRHGEAVGYRYIMGTLHRHRIVKESEREHRVGLEPTSPHYGCGILAAGPPVHFHCVMEPEGLEPSPARLRAGCAAANTWVPASTTEAVGSGGVEPPSPGYRPGALPLSYKPSQFPPLMGPEGFEPPPSGLKVRRAAFTPRPRRFGDRVAVFEPDHQEPPFGRKGPVRAAGFEPALSCSQGRRIARLSHAPSVRVAREGIEPSSPP